MNKLLTDTQMLAHLLTGERPEDEIHWEEITKLARRYGCAGWLYLQITKHADQTIVPDLILPALRLEYLAAVAHDAQREAELVQIFAALQAERIPVLALKGTALAYQTYDASSFRPTGDIDILVHPRDVPQTQATLELLGYCIEIESQARINPFDARVTGEISLRKVMGAAQFVIEIHWEIIVSDVFKRLSQLNLDDLWERAATVLIGNVKVGALSREDALWHVCVHVSLHGFTHLKGYLDIMQLATSKPFDWEYFVASAITRRTRAACYFPLWWAREAWNAAIPDRVLRRLQPGSLHAKMGYRLVQRGVRAGALPGHAWEHIAQFVLADRVGDWFRVLIWLLFPGPGWLRERYHLNSRWHGLLWVVVHPWNVLREGMRSLMTFALHR